jgi:alkanesulfonate monooxygenase SsuD/methylene tetrahydromethanopterin reductase-like flavin-dependent oxidoreductase (luciferase family)
MAVGFIELCSLKLFVTETYYRRRGLAQRLALGVVPGAGWRAADIRTVARETEEAGYEALFATEVNNDVLAAAQLMGEVTRTLKVGSWVANIYLRHAYLCAKHAALIADATDGRLILGLGVSHAPINQVLGINMPSAVDALRNYVKEVTGWLKGEGPATHLPQEPATHHVPVQIGALSSSSVELAGEIADGVMPFLWSPERVRKSKKWSDRGRAKSCEQNPFEVSLGIPIFIGDDMTALMGAARANLGLYAGLPFFQRLLRVSGFEKDAVKAEQGGGGDALSDEFLNSVCLIGSVSRCRERLGAFTEAGVTLPILMPPIGVDGSRSVIRAFIP